VNTPEEQAAVAAKAVQIAGSGKVLNQTEVAPSKTSAK
jgi:hypothetical protein